MTRPIDSHVHLYPPEVNRDPAGWAAEQGEIHWSTLCTRGGRDGIRVQGFPDLDGLLRALDGAGVERAVLLGWYWQNPAACIRQNRFYAECLRVHRDRLGAFATLHPAAGWMAVREEIHWARESGFLGLGELSPHSQGYPIDDPVWLKALALAAELRLPVNLHVTNPEGRPYPGRSETPLEDFLRLARAFPRTNFILAHWGGLLPLRHPGAAALPNLYYDTAASPLEFDPGIWRRILDAVGPSRVIFGSDYPLNLYPKLGSEPEIGRIVAEANSAGMAPAELEAIFRGNILALIGG